jgi:hypothetical protein
MDWETMPDGSYAKTHPSRGRVARVVALDGYRWQLEVNVGFAGTRTTVPGPLERALDTADLYLMDFQITGPSAYDERRLNRLRILRQIPWMSYEGWL